MYSGSLLERCERRAWASSVLMVGGAVVGDQALVAVIVIAREHDCFSDIGVFDEPGFDLTEFDAKAANLDLEVIAPEELDVAVGKPAAEVAGAVHAGVGFSGERIAQKALGSQLRTVQVASRHASSTNVQLACHPHRDRFPSLIEDIYPCVRNRPADRNAS